MFVSRFAPNLLILGTVFLCAHGQYTGCPSEFQQMCECGYVHYGNESKRMYVTNCTNAGFEDAMMLKELPPETEVLIFVGNTVKDLPLNIFGIDTTFEKLHTINLSDNQIQSIKGKTFHNVASVKKLILNENDLYIVSKDHHPRMFSNFKSLQELHLKNAFTKKLKPSVDYLKNLAESFENSDLVNLQILNMESNEITGISPNEFCSLPSLEELYMGDNHLPDISLNFSCLPKLRKLDFGKNRISHLANKTMVELEKVEKLKLVLTDNPFNCDCHMLETLKWMNSTKVDIINKDELYCVDGSPLSKGKPIVSVPLSEFQCADAGKGDLPASSVSYVILAIGLIILSVVIALLIYKNKKEVGRFMRQLAEPVRNKFQYVSLDRRDVTIEV